MKTIAIFGGSGGVASQLTPFLNKKYKILSLSSKDVDVTDYSAVKTFFQENDVDIVLNFSGKKYDVFLSKISEEDKRDVGC